MPEKRSPEFLRKLQKLKPRAGRAALLAGTALLLTPLSGVLNRANAASYQFGDVTVTLQSVIGYTLGARTAPVDNAIATLNSDDGDRNFKSGFMENRLQALEELNIQDGDYGIRASALGWIDTVYLQNNKNTSSDTFNSYGVGPKGFPSATVANEGRRAEPLALFVYGAENFDSGNQRLTWQIGRQTITWGESLFTINGLSGLQAPIDFYEAESLPNPQSQALFLPTGAASFTYDLGNGILLAAYWQFEYEGSILPGVGSYFSGNDFIGPGAQRLLGSTISGGALSIYRGPDVHPRNGLDQFGFAAHDTIDAYQLGLYFIRAIPKTPGLYTSVPCCTGAGPAGLQIGKYNIFYAQPVNAYAASASTNLLGANIAGEISARTNQPLTSAPSYIGNTPGYGDELYATGNVLNAAISAIYLTPPFPLLTNGAAIAGEVDMNDVLGVTKNKAALVAGNTRGGGSFEITFTPNWFPASDWEITAPIGWTTTFLGDSQFTGAYAGTSTYDIGAQAIYKTNLTLGVNYQRYAGPPNRQANIDRDFFTFFVQRTF